MLKMKPFAFFVIGDMKGDTRNYFCVFVRGWRIMVLTWTDTITLSKPYQLLEKLVEAHCANKGITP